MSRQTYDDKCREAGEIVAAYNWQPEFSDDVANDVRKGQIPDGFAREVGKTIALFLTRPVIGYIGKSRKEAEEYEQTCRQHARRLARLRLLLAEIRTITPHNNT